MRSDFKNKAILLAILSVYGVNAVAADDSTVDAGTVEIISTTPLQGIGLPKNKIPAAVQTVKGEDIEQQKSTSIADFMNNNLMGVSINETQNNPYQPDVLFRGFTASPLLGTPQGLSIFQDGVRVNEPFGDAVNWDLIPVNAIANINLIPGSNPVFGLNTLGGSLSIVTKSGRTHKGASIEAITGSWGRKNVMAEYGAVSDDGSLDFFISGNYFDEDGWRDYSPTRVKQVFSKVGWQNDTSRLELSFTGAENDMIGNGLIQKEFIEDFGRESINTRPDQTKNDMAFFNLNGSHWFNDEVELAGNVYYRASNRSTLNGDANDDFNEDDNVDLNADDDISDAELATALANCAAGINAEEFCSGAINTSDSRQRGYGVNAQLTFTQDMFGKENQLVTGFGYNHSKVDFEQASELGLVNATRGVDGIGEENDEAEVQLKSKTRTWSLFATDTLSLTDALHLTVSGRYNYTRINNLDGITPKGNPESLTESASYNRLNPAIGLTYTPSSALTVYGSYNEANRAPTSIELGCAYQDLDNDGEGDTPCRLPNAMAGDPPLDQVVAKTFEVGARGNLTKDIRWTAAVYTTTNHDDIQFIASNSQGDGNFLNVGKTRRQGLDAGIAGSYGKVNWNLGYSFVRATYETPFEIANEGNTTADEDRIQVQKGDRLANLPDHSLKLRMVYQATPNWSIGTTINAFSDVYVRGNENNDHQEGVGVNQEGEEAVEDKGTVSGYTVVNLDTRYKFGNSGWQVFAKATNIFDKEYSTGGMLGENWFEDGAFAGDDEPSLMLMPGAPRAGWVGVRYDFK